MVLQKNLFKNITLTALVLTSAVSVFFFARASWFFGFGIWVSAAWIFLNSFFLFRLIEIGFTPRVRMSDKILLISILKFPVLYVAGYFILKSRLFPIYSILLGLTLFIFAFVITWVKFSLNSKAIAASSEGNLS